MNNSNGGVKMNVNARTPTLVYVGGYLLPNGVSKVEPSMIDQMSCNVTVIKHPSLPPEVVELFEQSAKDGSPPERLWVRVITSIAMQVGTQQIPVTVELQVVGISYGVPQAEKPKDAEAS